MFEARHVAFAVDTACPRCNRRVPLAPMQPSGCCSACDEVFELPDKLWVALVRLAEELDERLASRDRAIEDERTLAGRRVRYSIWRQAPSCERCSTALVTKFEGAPHSSTCPCCAEPAIDFPVPNSIADLVGTAKQVFVCDPQRFERHPSRRTWMLRLRGATPAERRRALVEIRARGQAPTRPASATSLTARRS